MLGRDGIMSDSWSWKVGILHTMGECFWEESETKIRRICRMAAGPDGNIIVIKGFVGGILRGAEEIDKAPMIVVSQDASEPQAGNCQALWGAIIKPANGNIPRFRLDK